MHALIVNSVVVELADATFEVHESLAWVDITNVSPAPEVGWAATNTAGAWTFTAPAAVAVDTRPSAKTALDTSDRTIVRCYEHGIAVPADWVTYRAALRTIVSGSATTTALPTAPAYPAGT